MLLKVFHNSLRKMLVHLQVIVLLFTLPVRKIRKATSRVSMLYCCDCLLILPATDCEDDAASVLDS